MAGIFPILTRSAAILALGYFVAWWRGILLLEPQFFAAFACLAILPMGPLLSEHTGESGMVKLRSAVVRSCRMIFLILLVSVVIVNLRLGRLLVPPAMVLVDAVLLGVTSAAAVGAVYLLLLRRFPPHAMKWTFRAAALGGVLLYRAAPDMADFAVERITIAGITPVALLWSGVCTLVVIALRKKLVYASPGA
ncbi:MAG TPA: hypothetical protein VMZ52_14850 [Bryobacteraceae bacterium]|nr:hypothetical protein [Bryobacteraceae bacterium]